MTALRVATRGSRLALAQTRCVVEALRRHEPDLEIETVIVSTHGDRDRTTALDRLNAVGVFTKQVEQALRDGRAEIAVHSFKDLPSEAARGLTIAAIPERLWAPDVLVAREPLAGLEALAAGATVGTSSPRRRALLAAMRDDLNILPVRGNVPTRIAKVDRGEFDVVVLARAGLERLGLAERISAVLDPMVFVPAPAQGALAVQCRTDDAATRNLARRIDHGPTRTVVLAERQVLAGLHPGCHAPIGVYARFEADDTMRLIGFLADPDARRPIRREVAGPAKDAEGLASRLVEAILTAGGADILKTLENA